MKFLIHFTVKAIEDSIFLEGETIDEIRDKATAELNRRGATNMWSEEI